MDKPPSPRQDMQDRFEAWFLERPEVWNAPYGVLKGKSQDGRARTVTFGRARILDATVLIYSPRFIVVQWQTAIRDLAHKGSERFITEAEAREWIKERMS